DGARAGRQGQVRPRGRAPTPRPARSAGGRRRSPPGPSRGQPLVRARAADHSWDRLQQHGDVKPDRPVLEVVEVEPYEVVEDEARAARNLPEAGDPRQDEVALA